MLRRCRIMRRHNGIKTCSGKVLYDRLVYKENMEIDRARGGVTG